jgi:hypothetical protein
MYEVLVVLIITDFEWTWLSYIDIIFIYTNTYTYMSCTCSKWESLILFTHSCEKICLKLGTYLKQLKIVEFVCRSEIVYFCDSVLLVLLACIVFQVSALLLFFVLFFFCIRICIIVLDILTFQDRFLYLYKTKIRKNKLYVFGQYFIFRKYKHSYREVIDNFFWLCQCKLNDLPSDKIFVIIKESEYCSNWGEQCEFKLQLPVLLSKLAQQHICCDTHSIAQCNVDGTICSAMFVECPQCVCRTQYGSDSLLPPTNELFPRRGITSRVVWYIWKTLSKIFNLYCLLIR